MFYVKRIDPLYGNSTPVRAGPAYKDVEAAKRLAQRYKAAVVIDAASGKYVSYGRGGPEAYIHAQ